MIFEPRLLSIPLLLSLLFAPFALDPSTEASADTVDATSSSTAAASLPFDTTPRSGDLVGIVQTIDAWQLAARGEEPVALARPHAASLPAALALLAERYGAETPLDQELVALTVTGPVAEALTAVVLDLLVLDAASRAAFDGVDPMTAEPKDVDLSAVIPAQQALFVSALRLGAALDAHPLLDLSLVLPGVYSMRLGLACSDDVYEDNLPLLIDECGNDIYRNNAGGGSALVALPAAALLDHGGADQYLPVQAAAVTGGGFAGAGFLYDEGGDDVYAAAEVNDGVNGGGSVGSGFLVDAGGDDLYEAGGWGTNGGGYIGGRGLLVDQGGDDAYTGTFEAINGGSAAGNGALWDDGGDDVYTAESLGVNGGAVAGTGLLYDRSGADVYTDDVIGSLQDATVLPKEVSGAQIDDA